MVKRFKFGMENEVQSTDTTDPAEILTEGEAEITDLETELGQVSLEGDRLFMAHEALTELADVTSNITEPTEVELSLIQNNIENIARINDEDVEETMPEAVNVVSVESYSRRGRGHAAIEEAAKSMWQRIKEWFAKMWDSFKEFIFKLLKKNQNKYKAVSEEAEKQIAKLDAFHKSIGDKSKSKEIIEQKIEEARDSIMQRLGDLTISNALFDLSDIRSKRDIEDIIGLNGLQYALDFTEEALGDTRKIISKAIPILPLLRSLRDESASSDKEEKVKETSSAILSDIDENLNDIRSNFNEELKKDSQLVLVLTSKSTPVFRLELQPRHPSYNYPTLRPITNSGEGSRMSKQPTYEWLQDALFDEQSIRRSMSALEAFDDDRTSSRIERLLESLNSDINSFDKSFHPADYPIDPWVVRDAGTAINNVMRTVFEIVRTMTTIFKSVSELKIRIANVLLRVVQPIFAKITVTYA